MEISVVVPTFNRPKELKKALESIRLQKDINLKEIEVLVVNDGGVDVVEIINSERKLGLNVRYFKHILCKKLPSARNTGIDNSKGKFISFLDDDDIFLPHHLKTLLNKLKSNENIDVVVSSCVVYDINKNRSELWDINIEPLLLDVTNLFPIHAALFRNFANTKARFDKKLNVLEDWDMWLRLMREYNYKFMKIKDFTVVYNRLINNSMIDNVSKEVSNYSEFGKIVRGLWDKWYVRDIRTYKFRYYLANMHWLVLSYLGEGKKINPHFYLYTIREIQKVWTGEEKENTLLDKIELAIKEDF
jgi:glycosyltransferase involved in cell wall biosynthesis